MKPKIKIASEKEFLNLLNEKLKEEVQEFIESESEEELADILEVIKSIEKVKGFDEKEIEKIRLKKFNERGGFDKRTILDD